ncbi:MAG: aminopeptidase [Candidatus Neomarinimicrobiota bacterium]|nr:MAG: aminopeptidase [Candidatus Neomarinimicrobiota bacterium]
MSNYHKYSQDFQADPQAQLARNAAVQRDIRELALNWESFRQIDHTFSQVITGELPITNQKKSGRCWGFAGLNLLRIALSRRYNLDSFEFSQNYFMFHDKLEKANYFLENILSTLEEPWDSRLLMHLLSDPIQDGGQWDMFVNLIEKYGLVPKSVMPESFQSSESMMMNRIVTRKLREFAAQLRHAHHRDGVGLNELRALKEDMLGVVYRLLAIHLGNPPQTFDWQARDKDNKFLRYEGLTPQQFYRDHVQVSLADKICLINAPMQDKPYQALFTVEYLGNVVEGRIVKYINLEVDRLKEYAIATLQDDQPVWFGCDVGKHFHRDLGVMDMDLYDYDLFYGVPIGMDKSTRLEYGDSMMTHAMLFTGVDLKDGRPRKWRVENSWGEKVGQKGYFIMSDSWFDEYLYEIVIDKQYLPEEIRQLYDQEPIRLAPWDPMGALAH